MGIATTTVATGTATVDEQALADIEAQKVKSKSRTRVNITCGDDSVDDREVDREVDRVERCVPSFLADVLPFRPVLVLSRGMISFCLL